MNRVSGYSDFCIFALGESHDYAERIVRQLGRQLSEVEDSEFDDGEMQVRPKTSVRSKSVFIVQSLDSEPSCDLHRKLCRLLFFAATVKDLGASEVTALVPYLSYSRQDRHVVSGDPLTNRFQAELLQTGGINRIVTMDVHDIPAFENAYRCQAVNLEASSLFSNIIARDMKEEELTVVSPDAGGLKRARAFAKLLSRRLGRDIPLAMVDKSRTEKGVVAHQLLGDVIRRTVLLYDDMISTGSTIYHSALACKRAGARRTVAIATHGLFCGNARQVLCGTNVDQLIVGDTVKNAISIGSLIDNDVRIIDTSELFSNWIREFQEFGTFQTKSAA